MFLEVIDREQKRPEDSERIRLIDIDLREFPDGTTLAISPSGRIYHISAEPAVVERILCSCDGTQAISDILAQSSNPDGFAEVLDMLRRDGCLTSAKARPAERDWVRFPVPPQELDLVDTTRVFLIGDDRLISLARKLDLAGELSMCKVVSLEQLKAIVGTIEQSSVVIALRTRFDYTFLTELNDLCATHGLRWTQFHIEQGHGWLGPSIVPGRTPDYRDLLGRRFSAMEQAELYEALITPSCNKATYIPPSTEVSWMLALFFTDVARWVVGAPAQTLCNEVEADPVKLRLVVHPILPLPHRQLHDPLPNHVKSGLDMLVDERTGLINIVQRIEHHPSIPASLTTTQSYVARTNRLYPWVNNTVCSGSTFSDYQVARNAAIGEGVERFCGNYIQPERTIKASYRDLVQRGEQALDPDRLVLYSDTLYEAPGFPFVRFTHDLQTYWIKGWSLTTGIPTWLPASMVYVNWHVGPYKDEPRTNFLYYPGLAAGQGLEDALASGIEETIERHATMVWWTNRQPLPALQLPPQLQAIWQGQPTELGQRAWLIHLDNEFDVPVMAGVVENVDEQLFTIGFAARPDPLEAAFKAWTEALTLQEMARDLDDPDGLIRQAVARRELLGRFLKPWRADRAYLDDFRADYRDICDLTTQVQFYLDPRAREYIRPWVDVPATRSFDTLPRLADPSLAGYQRTLESRGFEIFYADLTTPDVALAGMHVVRVLVPGLVPNFPAAFPFTGKEKIQQVAVELGWRSTPLSEEELNYFPLPHA